MLAGKQDGERIWINLLLGSQANSEAALKIMNGEKRMNKRGQFFIIFAVIIGLFVMGITSVYNSLSRTEFNAQTFYDMCDNYNYEIHRISELSSKGLISNEEESIRLFTLNFTKYHREKGNNLLLVYLYSKDNSIKVLNNFEEKIKINGDEFNYLDNLQTINGNAPFSISVDDSQIKTDIYLNSHDFYYLIQLKKGEETFSCES